MEMEANNNDHIAQVPALLTAHHKCSKKVLHTCKASLFYAKASWALSSESLNNINGMMMAACQVRLRIRT
jgi:hypothetical protein